MIRKITAMLVALILLMLTGCSVLDSAEEPTPTPQPTSFSKSGMTVTLTDAFTEKDYVTYTAVYESADIAIFALKEEFRLFDSSVLSSESAVTEYARLLWKSNGFSNELNLSEQDGLTWFQYDRAVNGGDYTYRVYVYKGTDSFWMVQFTAYADRFADVETVIHEYAKTVVIE